MLDPPPHTAVHQHLVREIDKILQGNLDALWTLVGYIRILHEQPGPSSRQPASSRQRLSYDSLCQNETQSGRDSLGESAKDDG